MSELTRDTLECIMTASADLTSAAVTKALTPVVTCRFDDQWTPPNGVRIIATCTLGPLSLTYPITGEVEGVLTLDELFGKLTPLTFWGDRGVGFVIYSDVIATAVIEYIKENVTDQTMRWHDTFYRPGPSWYTGKTREYIPAGSDVDDVSWLDWSGEW